MIIIDKETGLEYEVLGGEVGNYPTWGGIATHGFLLHGGVIVEINPKNDDQSPPRSPGGQG